MYIIIQCPIEYLYYGRAQNAFGDGERNYAVDPILISRRAPPQAVAITAHIQATTASAHGGTMANAEYDGRAHNAFGEGERNYARTKRIRRRREKLCEST